MKFLVHGLVAAFVLLASVDPLRGAPEPIPSGQQKPTVRGSESGNGLLVEIFDGVIAVLSGNQKRNLWRAVLAGGLEGEGALSALGPSMWGKGTSEALALNEDPTLTRQGNLDFREAWASLDSARSTGPKGPGFTSQELIAGEELTNYICPFEFRLFRGTPIPGQTEGPLFLVPSHDERLTVWFSIPRDPSQNGRPEYTTWKNLGFDYGDAVFLQVAELPQIWAAFHQSVVGEEGDESLSWVFGYTQGTCVLKTSVH